MNKNKRNEWYKNKKIDENDVEIVIQLKGSSQFNVRITVFNSSEPEGQLVVVCNETDKENKSYDLKYWDGNQPDTEQKLFNLWEIFHREIIDKSVDTECFIQGPEYDL
jgi:hypothetical protein